MDIWDEKELRSFLSENRNKIKSATCGPYVSPHPLSDCIPIGEGVSREKCRPSKTWLCHLRPASASEDDLAIVHYAMDLPITRQRLEEILGRYGIKISL